MSLRNLFRKVKDYSVLVVGDAIEDQYYYVDVLGKASKENVLASRLVRTEMYSGGVIAAANHVRNFCAHVDVLVGDKSTVKLRYVDEVYMRKLFEVQWDTPVVNIPLPSLPFGDYDLVIVTDFGHGCVTEELKHDLYWETQYVAVNAQTNAANYGYNLITKYKRPSFVVIDEPEARLAACEKESPINEVILKLGFQNIIVTHGVHGSIGYDGTAFCHAHAYTQKVVDTMGAGDAFFVITALLAKAGVPMQELVKIGNAAGAAKVGIIGHQRSVTLEDLEDVMGEARRSAAPRESRVPVRERG